LITGLTSAVSPRVDISSTCKKLGVSPSVDMLPFSVTIPATVPQRLEIPEGLMNYPVHQGMEQFKLCRNSAFFAEKNRSLLLLQKDTVLFTTYTTDVTLTFC
jgi:hypothetical protein